MAAPTPSQTDAKQHPTIPPPFEAEVAVVLQELRPALAGVLEGLTPPILRATDLGRRLSIDKNLSWHIFNAATAHDTRTLASLLPGRRAMERFFTAVAVQGVADGAIDRARAAYERFEASVERHAANRDAFAAMVAGIGLRDQGLDNHAAADAKQKRAMFRAASLLWGRQARVGLHALVVHPSAQPNLIDKVSVRATIGLHRTRRGVTLHTMGSLTHAPRRGDPPGPIAFEALDTREASPDSVGLLRDFCSQPPPQFRLQPCGEQSISYELVSNGVGVSSDVSFALGHVMRASGVMPGSVAGSEIAMSARVVAPWEVYIGDMLMHESVWDEGLPEVRVYAYPSQGSALEYRDADLLPIIEKTHYLGRGVDSGRTPLIPRYAEMMLYAMERVGWKPEEFRVFRCRVDYPVVQSRIRMRFAR
ncbi:MAG: hypothetical protein WD749_07090 [Phycisphaerales bacterium]